MLSYMNRDHDDICCQILTATMRIYVVRFEQMQHWIAEFLRKFQGWGIKIDNVNKIFVAKLIYILQYRMITWNSLPDLVKVNVSFSMFKSKVRNLYLEKY